MDIYDKIFWLLVSVPMLPCAISFFVGGVTGTLIMAILNSISDYKDPNINNCNDCYYFNYYLKGGENDGVR